MDSRSPPISAVGFSERPGGVAVNDARELRLVRQTLEERALGMRMLEDTEQLAALRWRRRVCPCPFFACPLFPGYGGYGKGEP